MIDSSLLICTDLDRTLIPNGVQPQSPEAMYMFKALVSRAHIKLAFVTGRHRALVEAAIAKYHLPPPDYVIADVGTAIYAIENGNWSPWEQWEWEIGLAWGRAESADIHALLQDIDELMLQEQQKQGSFKLSYYVPLGCEREELGQKILSRLHAEDINVALVWSMDSQDAVGLLDILPASATKQHAIEFLMEEMGFGLHNTIFAGDSGNDASVLSGPIKSVLVANADADVRQDVVREAEARRHADDLYLAQGGFNGMNGNYSAGILEGIVHYFPQIGKLLRR